MSPLEKITAFGPATVGNAAVGFDILGFALEEPGDRVTVERIDEPEVDLAEISGLVTDLPEEPEQNTATAGLVRLVEERDLEFGFRVSIDKGIPLGGGLGGSAASAVAAVWAAAQLLDDGLGRTEILDFALTGEAAATGARHADNVTPCLYGGLTLTRSIDPVDVVEIPVPDEIRCAVASPKWRIDTRRARQAIPGRLELADYVEQSANLAGFVAGCYRDDPELIGRSMSDVLVEPHRAELIPGFASVRRAALEAGALGASISGAGPAVFGWCRAGDDQRVASAMAEAFSDHVEDVSVWSGPVGRGGVRRVDE